MANGYTRSPKLQKGALIQFSAPLLVPIPNIIVFQYNPESMTRKISPWKSTGTTETGKSDCAEDSTKALNPLAQPIDPGETFDLTLELDAADALEEPDNNRVAVLAGVADRIAAIELLLYPPGDTGLGRLINTVSNAFGGGNVVDVTPRKTVPVVLFYWGLGRILPIRIESYSVDEQAYSPTLFPIRATVKLGIRTLDAASFGDDRRATVKIAKACYAYTRAQKEVLALSRIAEEIVPGDLPF